MPLNRVVIRMLATLLVSVAWFGHAAGVSADEPLPLLLDLNMERVEGNRVFDAGPLGLHAEVRSGNVEQADGRHGRGLYFPGEEQNLVRVTGGLINEIGSPFTLSLWIRPEALPPEDHSAGIIGKRREFWQEKPFVVLMGADGALIIETGNGSENANAILHNVLPLHRWTHLAITHEAGGDRVVYINGEERHRQLLRGTLASNDQGIHLGYERGRDLPHIRRAPFKGWMDEVRIYAAALTPQQVRRDMEGRPDSVRAAKAEDYADPIFIAELVLSRFDRPLGFAKREAMTREQAYRRGGPHAVDWVRLTLDGETLFENAGSERVVLPLRRDPLNRPLFMQDYDHVLEPLDLRFRSVLWIWGRRYVYTIDPATRSDSRKMEIWTFPVLIASDDEDKITSVRVTVGDQVVYDRDEALQSLTLLLPRSARDRPYEISVNGSEAVRIEAGLEPITPGDPREVPIVVNETVPGTSFSIRTPQRPQDMPNRQEWRQDMAAMLDGEGLPETNHVASAEVKGFGRYLGIDVPRSPVMVHNVHMTHGMSGGHFWGSAQGPDAVHAGNTAFGVFGDLDDYTDHLQYLGIDLIIEQANDRTLALTDDRSVERFFEALEKRGIRGGLNVHALQDSNLPFYAWNLPDFWEPKLREMRLLTQRFESFRSFAAVTYMGDNAGYVPYWHWAPPIPNRPWGEAMSVFFGGSEVAIPIGPALPVDANFNERRGTQREFVDYIRRYDETFSRLGQFGEAAREIKPDLWTSTQAFGSAPGVGAEGGWPWSSQPGREIFENFSVLQSYDWDETYSSKPLHNVALLDRLRSYHPDKPAWALLDYFHLKFGPETLRRSYALALTRGVAAVGVNWISHPTGQYARPHKVAQDREINHWTRRMGGVYGGTEPTPTIGILYIHEQAISRRIPPGRGDLEFLRTGSHEGKAAEALFLSHAAGFPAKIITPDEVERGLPESMQAILLVGLNRFDDTWVWHDDHAGLTERLQAFVQGGGRVLIDHESVSPVEATATNMTVLSYIRQGSGHTDNPSLDETPHLIERNLDNIARLRAAMDGLDRPVAFSQDPTIWAIPHQTGSTLYVTVVNQASPPGENATAVVQPQSGTLQWTTDRPIYDVTAGRIVPEGQRDTVDLTETAVRIYALPAGEPSRPKLAVHRGEDGFYAVRVETGPGITGTPVEIALAHDDDRATLFGATGKAIRLPVTGNEPGAYELTATDLLTGESETIVFDVTAEPTQLPWQADTSRQRVRSFVARGDTPLTLALTASQQGNADTMRQVEQLKRVLEDAGRSVTVRRLAPFEVVEHVQVYHAGQQFPRWSTIAEDLVLIGTPGDNILIYDQTRGGLLPPHENGRVAWTASAFRNGFDVLTLFADDAEGIATATRPSAPAWPTDQ
jgi:hypothetical protein